MPPGVYCTVRGKDGEGVRDELGVKEVRKHEEARCERGSRVRPSGRRERQKKVMCE